MRTDKETRFYNAALAYCKVWTRDNRNTNKPDAVSRELDKSRNELYQAYRDLRQEGEQEGAFRQGNREQNLEPTTSERNVIPGPGPAQERPQEREQEG